MAKLRDKLRQKALKENSEQDISAIANVIEKAQVATIVIDPNLQSFIPPLSEEEKTLLETSIREEGVREPLQVWKREDESVILIDGHNRYEIIQKLQSEGRRVEFGLNYITFPSIEEVKDWMLINQLGRRNLTDEQRSYLRGVRLEREKKKHGGDRKSRHQIDAIKTSEKLGKEYNVGQATIERDAQYARGLDKIGEGNLNLKREILGGKVKVKKSTLQALGKIKDEKLPVFNTSNDIETYTQKKNKKPAKPLKISKEEIKIQEYKAQIKDYVDILNAGSDKKSFDKLRKLIDSFEKYCESTQ
ncbi:ParB/Srx family N-terminal domain-containing protein [Chondrinema litorale]|uniref:ParB/Srx family N-terminal domain-containing protein n=1 Tax=Chondrinema litorale TaxID=2994555 RepID=UPI002542BD97|nr:ParB/Srx family N-terminal domain-containing protein [Chondrinema litorale]UZR98427.1 ParB/Srx family N-terminal domain-containing protein [Chondrinema litorale]